MILQQSKQEQVQMNYFKEAIAIFCFVFTSYAEAQTIYYKLLSVQNGNLVNRNVSGGQFITFEAAICQETHINGVPVGNGYLRRDYYNHNKYVGKAFWGNNTTFVFSSDKSSLTVNAPNGDVYNYVKSTAPQGVTTCSLIKGKSSAPSIGEGDSYIATPRTSGNASSSGANRQCSVCHGSGYIHENVTSQTMCQQCYGRGECHSCSGKGWYTGYAISEKINCNSCSRTGRCRNCNGSGKINKIDYNKSVKCRSCNGTGKK